jgi:DNA-binding IscR family transcriptional regulator
MSWALKALILIRLDAVEGAPVTVSVLAEYFNCSLDQVRNAAEMLVAEGEVLAERNADGAIALLHTPAGLLHGAQR